MFISHPQISSRCKTRNFLWQMCEKSSFLGRIREWFNADKGLFGCKKKGLRVHLATSKYLFLVLIIIQAAHKVWDIRQCSLFHQNIHLIQTQV